MFTRKSQLSRNYAIEIYGQLISLSIPLIGICAAVAMIKITIVTYVSIQGGLLNQSETMVTDVIDLVVQGKSFS
jgi:hypothetical protein